MNQLVNFKTRTLGLAAALIGVLFLSSCSHLMYLNSAQNSFNKGAEMDNKILFESPIEDTASSSSYFKKAHTDVLKALNNKPGLKKDGVLGDALYIKAECEWKLGMYDKALESADDAVEEYLDMERNGLPVPKEKKLMMQALPSIMEIEKVKSDLEAFPSTDGFNYSKARQFYLENIYNPDKPNDARLKKAFDGVGEIRIKAAGLEDLPLYLLVSQLIGLKTWSDGLEFLRKSLRDDNTLPEGSKQEEKEFRSLQRGDFLNPAKEKLFQDLRNLPVSPEQIKALIEYWDPRI